MGGRDRYSLIASPPRPAVVPRLRGALPPRSGSLSQILSSPCETAPSPPQLIINSVGSLPSARYLNNARILSLLARTAASHPHSASQGSSGELYRLRDVLGEEGTTRREQLTMSQARRVATRERESQTRPRKGATPGSGGSMMMGGGCWEGAKPRRNMSPLRDMVSAEAIQRARGRKRREGLRSRWEMVIE